MPTSVRRLDGQRALVTGASSGSGHLHGRPSLLAALRLRGSRPRGRVGSP
jgi:hypothetical protein